MQTVTLTTPVSVNGNKVTSFTLRAPLAGDLRGLKMSEVFSFDTTAILALVPRIATEPLTREALDRMSAADLLTVCTTVAGFFERPETASPTTP
jgi:hypothetical protein